MKTNEELLKENAELRATIEVFASIAIDIENSETSLTGNGVFVKNSTINQFESARCKLPAQHLADIKADAVVGFWSTVIGAMQNNIIDQWDDLTIEDLINPKLLTTIYIGSDEDNIELEFISGVIVGNHDNKTDDYFFITINAND